MSAFSSHLQALFQQTGLSVYAMSKACGVERTFLHKILNGTRLPASEGVVEQIAAAMQVDQAEASVLYRQYQVCRDGEEAVERREAVERLLTGLNPPGRGTPFVVHRQVDVQSIPPVAGGRGTVLRLLKLLLEVEVSRPQGEVQLFCASEDPLLWQLLGLYLDTRPDLPVLQILCLRRGGTHRALLHNLELLRQALGLALGGDHYQAMACYGAQPSALLPNLLLTSRYALQFSQDCSYGLLCDDPQRVGLFRTLLDRQLRDCRPLIQPRGDPLPLLEEVRRGGEGTRIFSLSPQPWALPVLSPPLLEELLTGGTYTPEDRERILSYCAQSRRTLEGCQLTHYFTGSGLARMVQTGQLWELPDPGHSPLSPGVCREVLLGHLEAARACPGYTPVALDGDKLGISAHVVAETAADGRVSLIYRHPEAGPLSLLLEDPALCGALFDYLDSLGHSRFAASREDSLSLLRRTAQAL